MRKRTIIGFAAMLAVFGVMVAGCFGPSDADVASENVSTEAEQFHILRRIVFFNGITDKYLFTIEGFCSIESGAGTGVSGALEVTCKVGEEGNRSLIKKDYLGLSDNVSYMVEQLDAAGVSTSHYEVIFKPEAIVPTFVR
jgi:hypothetical protein